MPDSKPEAFETVSKLMKLKSFEQPSDDFVEGFIEKLHERQRSDLLKQSARGLLWERVTTYWDDLVNPKWAVGMAGAAAALALLWLVTPSVQIEGGPSLAEQKPVSVGQDSRAEPFFLDAVRLNVSDSDQPSADAAIYLSRHFSGGFADEAREMHASTYSASGSVFPASDAR